MINGDLCPGCGGSGWVEVRTRGMCGCDTDFEELERTPCEVCAARVDIPARLQGDDLTCERVAG